MCRGGGCTRGDVSGVRRQWLRSIPLSRDVAPRQPRTRARGFRARHTQAATRLQARVRICIAVKSNVHGRQKIGVTDRGRKEYSKTDYEVGSERVRQQSEYELLVQELYLFTAFVVRLPVVVVLLLLLPVFWLALLLLVWTYHDAACWPLGRACVPELLF